MILSLLHLRQNLKLNYKTQILSIKLHGKTKDLYEPYAINITSLI